MPKYVAIQLDNAQKDGLVDDTPIYCAEEMLGGSNTARILLGSDVYILHKTRQNKLLLTK